MPRESLPRPRHDRAKQLVLPEDEPAPFLQAVGIMGESGQIIASKRRKFKQINAFLSLVQPTLAVFSPAQNRPLRVVDFGCGNGYLTFALYHYLTAMQGFQVEMAGVDRKADLMEKMNWQAAALGWNGLAFQAGEIAGYSAPAPPEMVVALHACDTATDDALAQGLRWGSRVIISAPCCHHHLQAQLRAQAPVRPFEPVMRHGILSERLGDVVTDALRAQLLQARGYKTDVVEFVSPEHTTKNLMIRAAWRGQPGQPADREAYQRLRDFWGVTPYLESVLARGGVHLD